MVNNNGFLGDFQDKNGNGIKEDGEPYIDKPEVAEYFSNTDNALLISYARQVHPISGCRWQTSSSSTNPFFQNSGTGFGIDIGLIAEPYKGLRVGAMLLDANGYPSPLGILPTHRHSLARADSDSARLTTLPFHVLGKGAIGADFETDQADLEVGGAGGGMLLRVGAEYWLFNTLALRGGWNGHGLSAGAGLRLGINAMSFFINYAFNTHTLGGSQRISVSGEF